MINTKPLVSVLMTVYNREKYISEAIESVIASTYQNWELIIVDDQSKDRSVEIAKQYEEKDARIKVFVNEQNLGDYPNRNKAASYATGKYIKYVDADDVIYPHGLVLMVEAMEKFPNAGYGLSMVEQEDAQPYPFELTSAQAFEKHYFTQSIFHKSPLGAIIKREVFEDNGGFSGKQHVGDFELWHLLATEKPIILMTGGLAWYRNHDDQQMNDNRTNPLVPFKYFSISLEQLQNSQCPLNNLRKKQAITIVSKRMSRYIIHNIISINLRDVATMKALSKMSWLKILSLAFNIK